MRAAVTGGAGFIGSHVVDALVARGDEVHVVDNFATGRRENLNEAATLYEHDIREPLAGVFEEIQPELVVHLAAQADVGTSVERPLFDAEVNVVGTLNVLEAARPHGAQLVFSSTGGAIYGECERPAREEDERRPVSPYGTAKLAAEEYLATWNRLHGTPSRRAPIRERLRAAAAGEARGRRRRDLHGPAPRRRRRDDLRRRRADARLRLRRRRRRRGARRGRPRRRRLQRRHRDGDVRESSSSTAAGGWPGSKRSRRTRPHDRETPCGASSTSPDRSGSSAGGRRRRSRRGCA